MDLRLRTIRKAAQEIGHSRSTIDKLLSKGVLQRHKIPGHSTVYVSLTEFEALAQPVNKATS